MSEYVIDASALVDAIAKKDSAAEATAERIFEATGHAPHLIDAEVGDVLRQLVHRKEITAETALTALHALPNLVDFRYSHTRKLLGLAWELRHNISFYDGLYVALATVLDLPLLTGDVKLSKAPGLTCVVELIR